MKAISQSSDGKLGYIAFYDRENKLIHEIKGSYTTGGENITCELKPNEKLCGVRFVDSAYVIMGCCFKIASGGKIMEKVITEIQDPS